MRVRVPDPTAIELQMAERAGRWWENKLLRPGSGGSVASDDAESDARFALVELLCAWRDDPELRRKFGIRQELIRACIRRRTVDVYRTRAGRNEFARELHMRRLDEPFGEGETYGDLIVDASQNTERAALARIEMEAYVNEKLRIKQMREHDQAWNGNREGPSINRLPPCTLSHRMIEVLWLAAEGNSSEEIAALLFITADTVKTHKERIRKILGVPSITNAVHVAHLRGIFDGMPVEKMLPLLAA